MLSSVSNKWTPSPCTHKGIPNHHPGLSSIFSFFSGRKTRVKRKIVVGRKLCVWLCRIWKKIDRDFLFYPKWWGKSIPQSKQFNTFTQGALLLHQYQSILFKITKITVLINFHNGMRFYSQETLKKDSFGFFFQREKEEEKGRGRWLSWATRCCTKLLLFLLLFII